MQLFVCMISLYPCYAHLLKLPRVVRGARQSPELLHDASLTRGQPQFANLSIEISEFTKF